MFVPWPHQTFGIEETLAAIDRGQRRICLTTPTGGGKTYTMTELARRVLEVDRNVVLYSNRKLLIDQTRRVLTAAGLEHGVRAAGHADRRERALQLSSIQTEHSRVMKSKVWDSLHDAALALVDEGHLQTGPSAKAILDAHHAAGAAYVMVTATPLDMGGVCDHLIVAGTTSELRACGALVVCKHYGPDEPDLKCIGKVPAGAELTEKQAVKAIMTPTIFARVLDSFQRLNPGHEPTILFAPGVRESIWFAEQFHAAGISAAHIDGEHVWVNGQLYPTSQTAREAILEGSENGNIKVLCNRFVLREGIDAPWLAHGIFATVFGSLQSYLQSGGRLLRAHPALDSVTLQDHGGNWHRHGSLNADREWQLHYTASLVAGLREEALRAKQLKEPVRCPQCSMILACATCPCGYTVEGAKKSRPVIQSDGTMKEMHGDIYKPRRISQNPNAEKLWERVYYRAKNSKSRMTFNQAKALFAMENNWGWPSPHLPFMPTSPADLFLPVADVPKERLRCK